MPEKQRPKKNDINSLTFEEALARLEKTIEQLEAADLTLDESLRFFEQGISLIRTCDTHLKKAKGKVTELLKGENGEYIEKVLGTTLESFVAQEETDE
ncbi:MAG: exodeoxyribonuclease VII small subunit [Chitinispirillaceae bacterium]|jgi:exodeoxyribonuclease VII small subunit